ncbi:protein TolR [Luteimonas sp. MJ293]|uniref:protein TolR n=1 Tax=Luteimonas sp. MJ146 TaxID=3129240 RepID=UPI0031BA01EB
MSVISNRRRHRRKLKNEINVVPYIDVMLVLLIIFMVTAPLLNLGTQVNLPDSSARSLGSPKDPVVVSVYADGSLGLMIENVNQAVDVAGLRERMQAIHNQNPEASVLVNGDRDASYQSVIRAIDTINQAGVTRVSLISRPQEGGE